MSNLNQITLETKKKVKLSDLVTVIKELGGINADVTSGSIGDDRQGYNPSAWIGMNPNYVTIQVLDSGKYMINGLIDIKTDLINSSLSYRGKKFMIDGESLTPDLIEKIKEHYKDR